MKYELNVDSILHSWKAALLPEKNLLKQFKAVIGDAHVSILVCKQGNVASKSDTRKCFCDLKRDDDD